MQRCRIDANNLWECQSHSHNFLVAVPDREGVFVSDSVIYPIDRIADHAFRHFRVDLSRRHMLVTEHLAQNQQRHAVHQRNRRGERMPFFARMVRFHYKQQIYLLLFYDSRTIRDTHFLPAAYPDKHLQTKIAYQVTIDGISQQFRVILISLRFCVLSEI